MFQVGAQDLNYSPRRVVLRNVLVGYVAAEAGEALHVETEMYDRSQFWAGGEEAANAADRLLQQLQTAKDDFAKISAAVEHERGRATDCSHHGSLWRGQNSSSLSLHLEQCRSAWPTC